MSKDNLMKHLKDRVTELENDRRESTIFKETILELLKVYDILGMDPAGNIETIVNKTCEILNGSCSLYNRLDSEKRSLYSWSAHNLQDDFIKKGPPHGHICHELSIKSKNKPLIINDIESTNLFKKDPNITKYGFKSYLGYPVSLNGKIIGSLSVINLSKREFMPNDIMTISILAKAIGFEENRKLADLSIRESEKKYRLLIENSNDYIFVIQDGLIKFSNSNLSKAMGYSEAELATIPFINHIHPDDREMVMERHIRRLNGEIFSPSIYSFRVINKSGHLLWGEVNAAFMEWNGKQAVICFIRDITKQREVEKELRLVNHELEIRVEERTKELEQKARRLQEMNTAMKVLLENRSNDRSDLEKEMRFNVQGLINPYLEKLSGTLSTEKQRIYADIIRIQLEKISSPFGRSLSTYQLMLTPTEIKVADLIKSGKTTKDIAALLALSPKTIAFHRAHLRKKMGLTNSKINLRTHLLKRG